MSMLQEKRRSCKWAKSPYENAIEKQIREQKRLADKELREQKSKPSKRRVFKLLHQ